MRLSRVFGLTVAAAVLLCAHQSFAVDPWGLKPGAVELKSAGPLAFGPEGILFVGDPTSASVVAIATDDAKRETAKDNINIPGFQQKLADALGTAADQTRVVDLAVNPASRNIYLTVSSGAQGQPGQPALVRISTRRQAQQGRARQRPPCAASRCPTCPTARRPAAGAVTRERIDHRPDVR